MARPPPPPASDASVVYDTKYDRPKIPNATWRNYDLVAQQLRTQQTQSEACDHVTAFTSLKPSPRVDADSEWAQLDTTTTSYQVVDENEEQTYTYDETHA